MSAKTKIIVLRMKELIYTGIFVGLVILLIVLFFAMFRPQKNKLSPSTEAAPASYTPGTYSSTLAIGSQHVNVEVSVDAEQITSIALVPLSESVAAMYPLMQPAMDTLSAQIIEKQTLEGIEYTAGSQYTSMALMKAIEAAISKANINLIEN